MIKGQQRVNVFPLCCDSPGGGQRLTGDLMDLWSSSAFTRTPDPSEACLRADWLSLMIDSKSLTLVDPSGL